jgi:hypothetical protein
VYLSATSRKKTFPLLRFILVTFLLSGLYACGSVSNKGDYTFSEKARRIKLGIGEIKEITINSQRDSTWQVIGSSENKEIVDVTSKQDPSEETATTNIPHNGSLTFMVKGVTTGKIRVVFAEKKKAESGPGRILKTYLVDVVTE